MEDHLKRVYVTTGRHSGAWNMAFDRYLMEMVRSGTFGFVLRTYGWEPACVSLGRLQKVEREIAREKLLSDGYGLVRRPTGGRAVWHETEITYSIVAPVDHPMVTGSISEALRKTSAPMTKALGSLGIEVDANSSENHRAGGPRMAANPCFTSHGKWEVGTPDGRKLVGSAQARSRGVFLEHGSILLENDQLKILDYLPEAVSPGTRETLRHHLTEGIATIREFRADVEEEHLEEAIYTAFRQELAAELPRLSFRDLLSGPGCRERLMTLERCCLDEI
jgi:lipoyl(octanoyl) transferase